MIFLDIFLGMHMDVLPFSFSFPFSWSALSDVESSTPTRFIHRCHHILRLLIPSRPLTTCNIHTYISIQVSVRAISDPVLSFFFLFLVIPHLHHIRFAIMIYFVI